MQTCSTSMLMVNSLEREPSTPTSLATMLLYQSVRILKTDLADLYSLVFLQKGRVSGACGQF